MLSQIFSKKGELEYVRLKTIFNSRKKVLGISFLLSDWKATFLFLDASTLACRAGAFFAFCFTLRAFLLGTVKKVYIGADGPEQRWGGSLVFALKD